MVTAYKKSMGFPVSRIRLVLPGMKLRVAKKIRKVWPQHWDSWRVWNKFQPNTIEFNRMMHDALNILVGSPQPYVPPTPTKKDLKLIRRGRIFHCGPTLARAYGRFTGHDKLEWGAAIYEFRAEQTLAAQTPWERAASISRLPRVVETFAPLPEPSFSWSF